MKFYEFNNYEYYALIAVVESEEYPMDIAIKAYTEEVADIEDDEKESTPDERTEEEALERYKKANIEWCNTEAAKIIDFYEQIDLGNKLSIRVDDNNYVLLLMDGTLC